MKNRIKRLIPPRIRPTIIRAYRELRYSKRPRSVSWTYAFGDVLQCCIAYNKHGGYCIPLDLRHGTIARALFSGEVAEEDTIQFLVSRSSGGDIVHAGAFVGDFLPALSKACDAENVVWAFEPGREHYRCALITLQINALANVKLINAALGEMIGEASLLISDANGPLSGGSRIVASVGKFDSVERVQTVTLDQFIPVDRNVSIVHLDVEGHEKEALTGSMRTIRRCCPVLVLETVPDKEWVAQHLAPLGYRIVGRVDSNTVLSVNRESAGQ